MRGRSWVVRIVGADGKTFGEERVEVEGVGEGYVEVARSERVGGAGAGDVIWSRGSGDVVDVAAYSEGDS